MAKAVPQSCPICLRAYDQAEMIAVHIDHGVIVKDQDVYLCRPCVNAITRAYAGELRASHDPEPIPESAAEPEDEVE